MCEETLALDLILERIRIIRCSDTGQNQTYETLKSVICFQNEL